MNRAQLYIVFALLVVIALLVLVVVRLLDWQDERRAHGEHRMSRRQRRALDRQRLDLNPALGRRDLWRRP